MNSIFVGTAGWSLSKENKVYFPGEGTHIERYARQLNASEINSSFYREHLASTYEKWAEAVPDHFKFSVKLNKLFTHVNKLQHNNCELSLKQSLNGILKLKKKLGCLLVQLPPSLNFVPATAENFFGDLRKIYQGTIAFEPRHASWNSESFYKIEKNFQITRVWADPDPAGFNLPETAQGVYLRLHGSPLIYKSDYDDGRLEGFAERIKSLKKNQKDIWCIFDNTTFGTATLNALKLKSLLSTKAGELSL